MAQTAAAAAVVVCKQPGVHNCSGNQTSPHQQTVWQSQSTLHSTPQAKQPTHLCADHLVFAPDNCLPSSSTRSITHMVTKKQCQHQQSAVADSRAKCLKPKHCVWLGQMLQQCIMDQCARWCVRGQGSSGPAQQQQQPSHRIPPLSAVLGAHGTMRSKYEDPDFDDRMVEYSEEDSDDERPKVRTVPAPAGDHQQLAGEHLPAGMHVKLAAHHAMQQWSAIAVGLCAAQHFQTEPPLTNVPSHAPRSTPAS